MKKLKSIAQRVRFYLKNTDLKLWAATLAAILYSLLIIASMQRSGDYNYVKTQKDKTGDHDIFNFSLHFINPPFLLYTGSFRTRMWFYCPQKHIRILPCEL